MKFKITVNDKFRIVSSKYYNSTLNLETGFFCRWGRTKDENPIMAPACEILDLEISAGKCLGCSFCYKGNSDKDEIKYMSFDIFKQVFNKVNTGILGQCALGITSLDANPQTFDIMWYLRSNKVIPNITINGRNIKDQEITELANVCGAVAVSHYNDKDCFDTIHKLSEARKEDKATLQQINIHQILCEEKYEDCVSLLHKIHENPQLHSELGAIVLLSLKPRGPRNKLMPIQDTEKVMRLMDLAEELKIQIGFDSCSSPSVFKWAEKVGRKKEIIQCADPCESGLFSWYVNVEGKAYPCSFCEGVGDWRTGIDLLQVSDFTDIWFHTRIVEWRNKLLNSSQSCSTCSMRSECRSCPIFDITPCKK